MEKRPLKFQQMLLLVVVGVLLFAAVNHLSSILGVLRFLLQIVSPLVVGACLAFVLNVPMHFFEQCFIKIRTRFKLKPRERLGSVLSLMLTLILTCLLLFFIGNTILPHLVDSVINIINTVNTNYPKFLDWLEEQGIPTDMIRGWIAEIDLTKILNTFKDNLQNILQTAFSAASGLMSALISGVTAIFFSIYVLASKKKLGSQSRRLLYAYVKKDWADKICEIASLSAKTFSKFISGQCLEAVILGLLFYITMCIFRFPYAGVISLLIGTTALIPYIGAFIGCILGALLIALIDPMKALFFVILFLVLQQLEGQLVYPRVVGNSVGLPAIWTLAAAFVGGALFGLAGMLFFIPLCSVLYSLLRRNVRDREKQQQEVVE